MDKLFRPSFILLDEDITAPVSGDSYLDPSDDVENGDFNLIISGDGSSDSSDGGE